MENLRRHDLDWLRFIAITILLFFHTGMLFSSWGWHIKNNETSNVFDYWMVWFHAWRMPLLLFISGAGTYMAIGKRTGKQFVGERFKRLIIPLVFGMLVVVPPQIYFERIENYASYWDFYKTVFEFKPYPGGSFSWHHLWFILYLFLYALITLPVLLFLRSSKSAGFKEGLIKVLSTRLGIVVIPSVVILVTQVLLRPYFPDETHDLKDLAYFIFYFSFFLFGMLCYAHAALWNSIGKNRTTLLLCCLGALVPFYISFMQFYKVVNLALTEDAVETMFDVSVIFVSWFTVITIIAFGQHYLNKPHKWLSHINEGLYPFYILHQTAIIGFGYYVCQQGWGVGVKFWVVILLTLFSCLVFYLTLVRPFNVIRFLFGMKQKK